MLLKMFNHLIKLWAKEFCKFFYLQVCQTPYVGLYVILNYTCIHNYRLFCSKGLLDQNSTNLLVDLRLQRSSSFVEFRVSLALTQVFDDFLFEVIFRVDRLYFDHRSICVFKWYSSFVEFHISISSDRRNSIN